MLQPCHYSSHRHATHLAIVQTGAAATVPAVSVNIRDQYSKRPHINRYTIDCICKALPSATAPDGPILLPVILLGTGREVRWAAALHEGCVHTLPGQPRLTCPRAAQHGSTRLQYPRSGHTCRRRVPRGTNSREIQRRRVSRQKEGYDLKVCVHQIFVNTGKISAAVIVVQVLAQVQNAGFGCEALLRLPPQRRRRNIDSRREFLRPRCRNDRTEKHCSRHHHEKSDAVCV